jgi:hypothetical protein
VGGTIASRLSLDVGHCCVWLANGLLGVNDDDLIRPLKSSLQRGAKVCDISRTEFRPDRQTAKVELLSWILMLAFAESSTKARRLQRVISCAKSSGHNE